MSLRNRSKKELEEERKKAEEEAAAQAYEEFVATFNEAPPQKGKVWVKAGTFDAGSRKEDTRDKGKLYKPTSKLPDILDKSSDKGHNASHMSDRPEKPGKKKEKEKRKSNLELFKEELKMIQEERAERHRIKNMYQRESGKATRFEAPEPKIPGFLGLDEPKLGSFDPGDPSTTNLYLGNLSPKITEQRLMELFGRFGPLASIKIMWPRTDDERSRGRNCGFVAFMNRKDGERALQHLNGKDIDGFEMKLGWGKAVPIPIHPIYIPPALVELTLPPLPTGLPFNAQPDKRDLDMVPPVNAPFDTETKEVLDKILERAVVKVVIPTERTLLQLIHRTIEFVIREGPMFEAMIMNRELSNPEFRFLFENQSPAHVYYRWKLFSILQGESPNLWSTKPFRMFKAGSIWKPPPLNPFLQGMPEELINFSDDLDDLNKKGSLSNAQRKRLEQMIRCTTPEREKVGETMVWCIEHADAAEEICQMMTEAMTSTSTPLPKKVARLYLVSDILHNCSVKVSNASFYRKGFQAKLSEIFEGLHNAYTSIESRLRAEQFKQRVMQCCRAWEDWAIYPQEFLVNLQNIFLGLVKRNPETEKIDNDDDYLDGAPLGDDVDGVPIEDVDGLPMGNGKGKLTGNGIDMNIKSNAPLLKSSAAISALMGYNDDEEDDEDIDGAPYDDLDGVPLSNNHSGMGKTGPAPGFVPSKWESVSPKRVEAQAMTLSKWDAMEGQQSDGSGSDNTPVYHQPDVLHKPLDHQENKYVDDEDLDGIPIEYEDYKRRSRASSEEESRSQEISEHSEEDSRNIDRLHPGDANEERRTKLREIEMKVMLYQDELEQGIRSLKSGYTVHRQVQHYRHKLLRKIERDEGSGNDRRHHRHRSRSNSPPDEPRRGHKRSRSPHKSSHRTRSRSPSSRRHRSRSPHRRRSNSHNRSPSRKHKKKSRH